MRTHSCRLITYGQKPPARLSRAPVKVDEIDRLKKGFWRELRAAIQVFPSGNSNFRMETNYLPVPISSQAQLIYNGFDPLNLTGGFNNSLEGFFRSKASR
jgi:hypothetical protein